MSKTSTEEKTIKEHACEAKPRLIECLANSGGVDVYDCKECGQSWEQDCEHHHYAYEHPTDIPKARQSVRLIHQDVLDGLKSLPSNSVHCCVTSPPYWGVRKYDLGDKEIGAEKTFDEFLERITEVFHEVKRVLHRNGTLWLNMGDSYNSKRSIGYYGDQAPHGRAPHGHERLTIKGLHQKNMLGQPWKVAFALQDAGWILRDDHPWEKPNCQPSSATDRTTKSHEYVFMLAKQGNYFFDWKAIEELPGMYDRSIRTVNRLLADHPDREKVINMLYSAIDDQIVEKRRRRSVWSINTQRFKGAHYSTFPEALVELCLQAGTSEMGACPECQKFITRLLVKDYSSEVDHGGLRKRADAPGAEVSESSVFRTGKTYNYLTQGWARNCNHEFKQSTPCVVLDPFMGSGTTGVVANNLGLNFIGIELSTESINMASDRITLGSQNALFTDFTMEGPGK